MFGRYKLSRADFEGYGVYEHDHVASGAYGQLPDLTPLQSGYVDVHGLAHVPAGAQAAVKQMLETMQLTSSADREYGGVSGTASYILGQLGQAWVSSLVNQGYVVMVDPDSVPSGAIKVLATNEPASVVLFSGTPNANYVIVDAHPIALAAAEAYRAGTTLPTVPPVQPTTGGCPAGQVSIGGQCWPAPPCGPGTYEVYGVCFPILGLPPGQAVPPGTLPTIPPTVPPTTPPGTQPTPQPVAQAGLPSWALPVAVGVGVIGLTTAVVMARRKG